MAQKLVQLLRQRLIPVVLNIEMVEVLPLVVLVQSLQQLVPEGLVFPGEGGKEDVEAVGEEEGAVVGQLVQLGGDGGGVERHHRLLQPGVQSFQIVPVQLPELLGEQAQEQEALGQTHGAGLEDVDKQRADGGEAGGGGVGGLVIAHVSGVEGLLDKVDALRQIPQQVNHTLAGGGEGELTGVGGVRSPPGEEAADAGENVGTALQLQSAEAVLALEVAAARLAHGKFGVHPVVLLLPEAGHPLGQRRFQLLRAGRALDGQVVLLVKLDLPAGTAGVLTGGGQTAEVLIIGGHQRGFQLDLFVGHGVFSFLFRVSERDTCIFSEMVRCAPYLGLHFMG